MTIRVKFVNGPLDKQIGHVANLPTLQLFFDKRQHTVYCYRRTDELVYEFDPEITEALSKDYDGAYERFGNGAESVKGWGKTRPHLTDDENVV